MALHLYTFQRCTSEALGGGAPNPSLFKKRFLEYPKKNSVPLVNAQIPCHETGSMSNFLEIDSCGFDIRFRIQLEKEMALILRTKIIHNSGKGQGGRTTKTLSNLIRKKFTTVGFCIETRRVPFLNYLGWRHVTLQHVAQIDAATCWSLWFDCIWGLNSSQDNMHVITIHTSREALQIKIHI